MKKVIIATAMGLAFSTGVWAADMTVFQCEAAIKTTEIIVAQRDAGKSREFMEGFVAGANTEAHGTNEALAILQLIVKAVYAANETYLQLRTKILTGCPASMK